MPSNIFATTGTNVSVLFLDKANVDGQVMLMDASKLGTAIKEGKAQKTLLSPEEEELIIDAFNSKSVVDSFTISVSYEEIKANNYSLSAGQYFDVKIPYEEISREQFSEIVVKFENEITVLFEQSTELEDQIKKTIGSLKYV